MAYSIDLSGRVAFVTGASGGLGAQFAWTLSRAGAAVVHDRAAAREDGREIHCPHYHDVSDVGDAAEISPAGAN